jgi:mannose-6-phosphate isomerase-like protein (cupin superfamily)
MNSPRAAILVVVLCALGGAWAGVREQAPSKAQQAASPRPARECCGYPFPRWLDAEIADSDVHRVHYEDEHVMLLEVSNPPLLDVHMHGHPFISVFAHDSDTGARNPAAPAAPPGGNGPMDPTSPYNDMGSGEGPAPHGMKWPTCTTAAPQAPHRPFNSNLNPNHFFRIEFLRVEGEDFQRHWKEWYPSMTAPVKPVKDIVRGPAPGPNFSEQWPYPIVYDSIQAAPNNYRLLFENEKMRLLEVTVRPGETTPMHGHPYPSVLTFNAISGDPALVTDKKLDPASPLNGQGAGHGGAPKVFNLKAPTCSTMAPQAPHAIHNGGAAPLHYYRIEYKRIDGDGFAANWKKWYPWMRYMRYMR